MATKPKQAQAPAYGQTATLTKKFIAAGQLRKLVEMALAEDIGAGDVTSCIFGPRARGEARLLAKEAGVLSGSRVVDEVFRQVNRGVKVKWLKSDGERFAAGDFLATISGPMRALLEGERLALNFLQQLSGVATLTRQFADLAEQVPGAPGIYDTRKTTPLLRVLEKQAVVHGGGKSHRFALYDAAMLKNNHIDAAGGVCPAVQRLEADGFFKRRPRLGLCIEARTLAEAVEATECRADIVLLDNMSPAEIRRAAAAVAARSEELGRTPPELEVSGGVTLKTLERYLKLPVQRISVGALTHSARAVDISMRFTQ